MNKVGGYLANSVDKFSVFIITLATGILIWNVLVDYRGQLQNLKEHSLYVSKATARGLDVLLSERQRTMSVFAEGQSKLLKKLSKNPEEETIDLIRENLKHHFPSFVSFAIADEKGKPMFADFDHTIGVVCRVGLEKFVTGHSPRISEIHPMSYNYHFDILSIWKHEEETLALFVSFNPEVLAHLLSNEQSSGHKLMIIHSAKSGLIEVTALGSRDKLGEEIFLSTDDLERLAEYGSVAEIESNHLWKVADVPEAALLESYLRNLILKLGVIILLFLFVIVLSLRWQRQRQAFIDAQNRSNKEINAILEQRVKDEVEKNKKQDQQLFAQTRMAQMGEMISMIAHQWRQPLGAIAATSIDLKIKLELQTYDLQELQSRKECQEYFIGGLCDIGSLTKTLTTTIDDFRDFYKPKTVFQILEVNNPIEKALNIMKGSLVANNIKVLKHCNSSNKLEMLESELMQVILNILKNAEDNFTQKEISNGEIVIVTQDISNGVVVTIQDNGGGVSKDIIDKVFDPYFSTKHEKNGTGLGLYMSKTIIEDHHHGILSIYNEGDGVVFKIELGLECKKEL